MGPGEVYQFEQGGVLQWNLVESRDLIVLDSYWNIHLIDPVKCEVIKTWPLQLEGLTSDQNQLTVNDIFLTDSITVVRKQLFNTNSGAELKVWEGSVVVGLQSNIMMLETKGGTQLSLEANPGSREIDIGRLQTIKSAH